MKKPRLIKHRIMLRLFAERYLDGRSYAELSSEDLVRVVHLARIVRMNELVHYIIGDIGLRRLNAFAHPACAGVVIAIMEDTR